MRKSQSLATDFMEEHIGILQCLSRNGSCSITEVSQRTELEPGFVLDRLLVLARLGLARRSVRQVGVWEITHNGRNILRDRDLE